MTPESTPRDRVSDRRKSPSGEPLLCIEELSVDYITARGRVRAVDNLNIQIGRGEVFGLAGESGSGKSTAAMGALRLLPAPAVITGGRVLFEGNDVLAMPHAELSRFRWREIAVVFQSAMNALNPVLTVGEQIVDVILTHERISRQAGLRRAAELLALMGLEAAHLGSYPHQLSGGMRQRVVMAIALCLRPKLLFMDEPTTALDVVVQKEVLQRLAELKEELGFSILFITHDLSLMLEFCDTIGVLYAGRLAEVAPARALLARPQHPYTQGLLNSFPHLSGSRHRMTGIGGTPPNMLSLPTGCAFHPRCSVAVPGCRASVPPLTQLAPRHLGACHLAAPYVGPLGRTDPGGIATAAATAPSATAPSATASVTDAQRLAGVRLPALGPDLIESDVEDRETVPDLHLALGPALPPSAEAETVGPPRVRALPQEEETLGPPEVTVDDNGGKGGSP